MTKNRLRIYIESLLLLFFLLEWSQALLTSHHGPLARRDSFLCASKDTTTTVSTGSYLATCIPGLSGVLADELDTLGCKNVQIASNSAVRFSADLQTALYTLLWARTPHKLMELLCQSITDDLLNRDDLYQFVRESIQVKDLLGDGKGGLLTLSVQVVLNNPSKIPKDINHSHYTALCIKNALCDEVRDLRGDRPSVDLQDPDVPLTAVLLGTDTGACISLYRQLHHGSLHRRGYRQGAIHKAALKESLAAGLLLHIGWQHQCQGAQNGKQAAILIDPMAGSGSLLLEGAMMAADLAPGLMRIKCGGDSLPPVVRWKHLDCPDIVDEWKELLVEATTRAKRGLQWMRSSPESVKILGNDWHAGALDLCQSSLDLAGLGHVIEIRQGNCLDWKPADSSVPWTVVTNPPWGVRLTNDMSESWEALRVFLRETCPAGTQAWVLSGNPAATKHLGLRKSQSLPIKTGQQDLRWIQYIIRGKSEGREEMENDLVHETKAKKTIISKERVESESLKRATERPETRPNRKKSAMRRKAVPAEENEWLID